MPSYPQLRMFAGPNGSGKSTMKALLAPELLGVYVNPDDIERSIRATGGRLDLATFGVQASADDFVTSSSVGRVNAHDRLRRRPIREESGFEVGRRSGATPAGLWPPAGVASQ